MKTKKSEYKVFFEGEEGEKRKIEAFDELATMFFDENYGSATKAEVELFMFSTLLEAMIDHYKKGNGVLDYAKCSDYCIGRMLGIPQERVRSLKVKKQARYRVEFNWRESLNEIKDQIIYDEQKNRIIIPVRDPNLYFEIQNFIEDNGGYIEIQRGRNCLQMRPESFFLLLYDGIEDETEKKKVRLEFIKRVKEHNNEVDLSTIKTNDDLNKIALSQFDDFMEIMEDVAEGIQNPMLMVIKCIKKIASVGRKRIEG